MNSDILYAQHCLLMDAERAADNESLECNRSGDLQGSGFWLQVASFLRRTRDIHNERWNKLGTRWSPD